MDNTTRLILMLDREFDKTIESIAKKQQLMDMSFSYRDKAEYAAQAAELEAYAETLLNIALQILEA